MSNQKLTKNYDGTLYSPLVGKERMPKFTDVWKDFETFSIDYKASPIPKNLKKDSTIETIFYLLYSKYGNSTIASSDVYRFKTRLFAIIFQCAPTWERRLEIQDTLRTISDEGIKDGSVQIYNDAENPTSLDENGNYFGTDTKEFLTYINRQNVTHNKKGVLEAYALLDSILKNDVTETFLKRFEVLFKKFPNIELELTYEESY